MLNGEDGYDVCIVGVEFFDDFVVIIVKCVNVFRDDKVAKKVIKKKVF